MTSYSILQITWPVLGLVIGLILVELVAPTTASVIGGYAIAQILAIVAVLPKLDFGKVFGWARQSVKAALRYSVPLVIGLLLVWLANNGIRFLVEQQQGAAAVGMLTIGWALGLRVASFAAMLVTAAAFPLAVNRAREQGMVEGQKQLVENGVLLLAILLPASVGLWLVSRPLMELIVAPAYQEMTALILPWAILAGTTRNFRIHFGEQVFLLHEQSTVPLINDAIDAVLTLIGAFVGLMLGGLVGSVIGAAAGGSISLVITLVWAMSEHRFTLPWQDLMKIGLSVAVMFLVLQLLPAEATVLSLAILTVSGAVVYSAIMSLFYPELSKSVLQKMRTFRNA